MPDLRKVHESDAEIRYADTKSLGWFGVLFGAGAAWVSFAQGSWFLGACFVLFVLMGAAIILRSAAMTFDLEERRYRYERGWRWRTVVEREGSFDDLEEILLLRQERRSEPEWEVELVVDGREHPIELMEIRDEEEARTEAESLASRLDLPLTERAEY